MDVLCALMGVFRMCLGETIAVCYAMPIFIPLSWIEHRVIGLYRMKSVIVRHQTQVQFCNTGLDCKFVVWEPLVPLC